jgi:hypothetical protein
MELAILFGNGLNRVTNNNISWENILLDLDQNARSSIPKNVPYTMIYERVLRDGAHGDEEAYKSRIAQKLLSLETNELYVELARLKARHYLTTNYDYCLEKALEATTIERSTEDIYSLRRRREVTSKFGIFDFWHIHGEAEKAKSMMLGLDHYCGSLAKLDQYVKGTYKSEDVPHKVETMQEKLLTGRFCYTSWIDLFFCAELHIFGLGLDYSETDLWWLLTRRAREIGRGDLIKNRVVYHDTSVNDDKITLLGQLNVEVRRYPVKDHQYKPVFHEIIRNIGEQC